MSAHTTESVLVEFLTDIEIELCDGDIELAKRRNATTAREHKLFAALAEARNALGRVTGGDAITLASQNVALHRELERVMPVVEAARALFYAGNADADEMGDDAFEREFDDAREAVINAVRALDATPPQRRSVMMRWTPTTPLFWRRWFAWYPVKIDGQYVWLEWVERGCHSYCGIGHYFEYRNKRSEAPPNDAQTESAT